MEYQIVEHIAALGTKNNGWTKELNIVSWNRRSPKFDIREWDENHEKMSKGITLTKEEVDAICKAMAERR